METFWSRRRNRRKKEKNHNKRIIKDRIIRDISTLFEQQENYYEPKRVTNFWNNNYLEYESNGDKNRDLSLDKYLSKSKPYLRNIIIDLQNSDTKKIKLTIAINLISSKDGEEEPVMHSSSINLKFTCYNDVNDVIDSRNINERNDFIIDSVQLMFYNCHRVNFICGGSYIGSAD